MPVELVVLIITKVLDLINLEYHVTDPLHSIPLISRAWRKTLWSAPMQNIIGSHPRYGLVWIKSLNYHLGNDVNRHFLRSATPLIDSEEALKILLEADNPVYYVHLMDLPIFQQTALDEEAYNLAIITAYENDWLPLILSPAQKNEHKFYANALVRIKKACLAVSLENRFVLHLLNPATITFLIFLEDWRKSESFTWFLSFIRKQVVLAASKEKLGEIKDFLDHLSKLRFPRYRVNILFSILQYPAFLAAFTGDRETFLKLRIDLDTVIQQANEANISIISERAQVLKEFVEGKHDQIPLEKLRLFASLTKFFEQYGFIDKPGTIARARSLLEQLPSQPAIMDEKTRRLLSRTARA